MTFSTGPRRRLLQAAAALLLPRVGWRPAQAQIGAARLRPTDAAWPAEADWNSLKLMVEGALVQVRSPLVACQSPDHLVDAAACDVLFKSLKNPYRLGDDVALTQSLGWVDAWTSMPSVYAVVARATSDVVAAVDFARTRNLRLVVKGGGHSYQGTSNAPDSLLIWTRRMNDITVHD